MLIHRFLCPLATPPLRDHAVPILVCLCVLGWSDAGDVKGRFVLLCVCVCVCVRQIFCMEGAIRSISSSKSIPMRKRLDLCRNQLNRQQMAFRKARLHGSAAARKGLRGEGRSDLEMGVRQCVHLCDLFTRTTPGALCDIHLRSLVAQHIHAYLILRGSCGCTMEICVHVCG